MNDSEVTRSTLYIVATPIGNLQDITRRALAILSSVDVIAAEDTRTTKVLLDHYGIVKPLVSYYSYNEQRRIPQLIERLLGGVSVAVVTDAGTPGISDPAVAIVRAAIEAGITVIPAPGPAAFVAALVVSGLATDRFVFEGFLPVKKGRRTRMQVLREEERTIVFYESPHRVQKTLRELREHLGNRRVAVARELTKKFEEVVRGRLDDVIEKITAKGPRGE